jgi:beta-glucosidase
MNDVEEGGPADNRNMRDMVRSGNDLYMVVNNYGAEINSMEDDLLAGLERGRLTIGELQQCAKHICGFLMDTAAMGRERKTASQYLELAPLDGTEERERSVAQGQGANVAEAGKTGTGEAAGTMTAAVVVEMGKTGYLRVLTEGIYHIQAHMMSVDFNTAQVGCALYVNGEKAVNISARGTEGRWIRQKLCRAHMRPGVYALRVEEVKPNLVVDELRFELV